MALSPGDCLGPYQILGPLGAGGMGEVYRASDSRLHREVAVKDAAAQFGERAAREARLIAALNHPNICHIYDVGPDYLVMELVEGETLAERLDRGALPFDEALGLATQIAGALEAAHEKGIVHRDLKPGNIKITPDGTVKVLDFGLAKAEEASAWAGSPDNSPTFTLELATRAGVVMGTAGYMSPEQARGKPVDKRADIWAFGVILYEMLAGQRMFKGDTLSDTLAAVLTREPDLSRAPVRAQSLLRRCLEKDPKQRLRDIGDARFLLEDDPPASPPDGKSAWPWKLAAGTLAIAALVSLAFLWTSTRRVRPALMSLSVDLGNDAALAPVRGASMALSPDGSRIVFVVGEQVVKSRLALRRLDQSKAVILAGTEGAEAPFFSPQGTEIAFFADGKLKKVDVAGGLPVTVCDAPRQRGGSWGDDGNIVFAGTNLGGLSRVPSAGGTPQSITELDKTAGDYTHRYPQVLPGASAVLFMNGLDFSGEGAIEALSLKTGKRKTLVEAGAYARYLPDGRLVYMHRGTLFATPMDPGRLELTGPPAALLEDVMFQPGTATAAYAFSQSGTFVYVASAPEDQMRPIGVVQEGGNVEPLPVPKGRYSRPRVSPDGSRLAVTARQGSGAGIWIYEWASQRFTRFALPNGNSEHAIWTPDGKHIIYFSGDSSPGPGIYSMRADGAGTPQRLVDGQDLVPWCVSVAGPRLFYDVTRGQKRGPWMSVLDWSDAAHPKAGVPERATGGDDAASSPDGRWLASVTGQSGLPEVFVRPSSGKGGQWQVSTGGDAPVWSLKSQKLFYRSISGFGIMAAGYAVAGDSFSPAKPRVWNGMRVEGFDLMPDGKRAVVIPAAVQKEATHATFLLNFAPGRQRVAAP